MGYAEKVNMFNINHRPLCFILTVRSKIIHRSFGYTVPEAHWQSSYPQSDYSSYNGQ